MRGAAKECCSGRTGARCINELYDVTWTEEDVSKHFNDEAYFWDPYIAEVYAEDGDVTRKTQGWCHIGDGDDKQGEVEALLAVRPSTSTCGTTRASTRSELEKAYMKPL